jgi:integrase
MIESIERRRKRGTGSIVERNGRWIAKCELPRDPETGERRYHFSTHDSVEKAQAAVTRALDNVKAGSYIPRESATVNEWLDTWLKEYAPYDMTPASLGTYANLLKHIRRHRGKVKLQALTAESLQKLWSTLMIGYEYDGQKVRLSPRVVSGVRGALSQALRQAVVMRKIATNPVRDTKRPKRNPLDLQAPAREKVQAFTADEVGTLLHGLRTSELPRLRDLYVPVALAAGTGMRKGEICGLRWCDVVLDPDAGKGTIKVRVAVETPDKGPGRLKEPKTESSRRDISIEGDTVRIMLAHRARVAEDGLALGLTLAGSWLVFPASPLTPETPRNPRIFGQAFTRAAESLKIADPTFHRLRHYHATMMLVDGELLVTVSNRLGHANPRITEEIYITVIKELRDKGGATAARAFDQANAYQPATPATVARLK